MSMTPYEHEASVESFESTRGMPHPGLQNMRTRTGAIADYGPELRDKILASLTRRDMQDVPREVWAAAMAMDLIRDGWTKR